MKQLMVKIADIMTKDNRSLEGRVLKTTEEVGELAEAVLSYTKSPGCEYKGKTLDDITSEAADTMICAVSVAMHADPSLTHAGFMEVVNEKMGKWQRVLAEHTKPKTYIMVWVNEEENWHYFKETFDASQFKNGYAAYTIHVIKGIISVDMYRYSNIGKLFADAYKNIKWR